MAVVGTLCTTVILLNTLAVGQEMPTPSPEAGDSSMLFTDKPEFLVLPRKDDAAAVKCAVYSPQLSHSPTKKGLVVHLYGRGGSCRSHNMMRESYAEVRRLLWERGYWLVVPDLGTDHWMNDRACKSVDAVIEGMIRDRDVDPARVHILGTSMGGGSGLAYVMRRPNRIRSICAVFPMTDFEQWVQERPGYLSGIARAHGVEPSEASSVLKALSALQHVESFAGIPVFLLHGSADTTVPTHHSREFAAALRNQNSPVTYREVPGLAHTDAVAEQFQQEIVEFLTDTAAQSESACKQ